MYLNMLNTFEKRDENLFRQYQYDAIFIDEGQDLVQEDYLFLYKLVKPDDRTGEKNLIIFYDDAQNLYGRDRPTWQHFGINLQIGDRSRVMKQCHRNTREVLDFSFNLLMGTQAVHPNKPKMRKFADIATLKQNDLIDENERCFRVKFCKNAFKLKPFIKIASSRNEEKEWLASEVISLIYAYEVRPEDILILFDSCYEYSDLSNIIKKKDQNRKIEGYIHPYGNNNHDKDNYIFRPNHLTISTTRGAKGYDSYIVFLIGADKFKTGKKGRASFYVGATRSKLVLYVSGVQNGENLFSESIRLDKIL